jgi:hypothetical protein
LTLLLAASLVACGKSSPPSFAPPTQLPTIDFAPQGSGWLATPVEDDLAEVSNNGLGYTGEIDVYELSIPATGRLQISLCWQHDADFDLIVAADMFADVRLAEGVRISSEPEYVGLPVQAGQTIYVLVAGWEGSPGDYLLETALLPPGVPEFDLETGGFDDPVARNHSIAVLFNADLDPIQDLSGTLVLVTQGHYAEGIWCVEGASLVFHPRLPEGPGDSGGLLEGLTYTLQFDRAARGPRAASGEYLAEVRSLTVEIGPYVDEDPLEPPRVMDVDQPTAQPWSGAPITVTIAGALDADTLIASLWTVDQMNGDLDTPLLIGVTLRQQQGCIGGAGTRLLVELLEPLPPASIVRLRIPGSVRGITGEDRPENRLTGPPPAPGGAGFSVDFRTP